LILVNIPFIVFLEWEKLSKKDHLSKFTWILTFFIGLLAVEYVGVAVHTQTSFFDQHDPEIIFWNVVALLFSGIGGFLLPIVDYIGEKLDKKITPTKIQLKLMGIGVISLAIFVNVFVYYVLDYGTHWFTILTSWIQNMI